MKEGVIDVLMYIFSSYIEEDDPLPDDRESMDADLQEAGFEPQSIERAFDWLEGLALAEEQEPVAQQAPSSMRFYAEQEMQRLDREARGFIAYLEQAGILNPTLRERVISSIMELQGDATIDLEQVKWVTMMVIYNTSNEDDLAMLHYEDLVFDQELARLH